MSKVLLPKRYKPDFKFSNRKPSGSLEVDRANKFGKHVVGALLPVGDSMVDVSDGRTYGPSSAGFVAGAGDQGHWVGSTTQHANEIPLGNAISDGGGEEKWASPVDEVTVLVVLRRTGTAAGNAPIFSNCNPSYFPTSSWNIVDKNGAGIARFEFNAGGLAKGIQSSGYILNDAKWHVVTGTYNGSTGILAVDESIQGVVAASGSIAYLNNSSHGPAVGNFFDYSGPRSFVGEIAFCLLLDKGFNQSELLELNASPYQVLKPKTSHVYSVVGGGGSSVFSDSEFQWSLLNAIQSDIDLKWSLLNAVQSDSALQWSLLNAVQSDSTLQWSVLQAITNDSDLRWDIQSSLSAVSGDITAQWNIINSVSADSDVRWSILNTVLNDSDLRWSLINLISNDADLRWSIDSALSSVANDLNIQWSIIAAVQSSLEAQWNIFNTVTNDSDLKWSILNTISRDLTAQWGVLEAIQSGAELQWDIISTTSSDITLRWRIESDSQFPDLEGKITLTSNTPKVTFNSITPKITLH